MQDPESRTIFAGVDGRTDTDLPAWYRERRPEHDPEPFAAAIRDLPRAVETSEWCADACLGDEEMERCARLCRDVADVASLHARLMARGSDYSGALAGACAAVCEACAEECRQHDADHCRETAAVLAECAESCRQMT